MDEREHETKVATSAAALGEGVAMMSNITFPKEKNIGRGKNLI